jgi:hypothetical protein
MDFNLELEKLKQKLIPSVKISQETSTLVLKKDPGKPALVKRRHQ